MAGFAGRIGSNVRRWLANSEYVVMTLITFLGQSIENTAYVTLLARQAFMFAIQRKTGGQMIERGRIGLRFGVHLC